MASFDCIVVGAGGMGSAALHELARRGARVLGLERFGVAHDRGSSHGVTRIIRKAYFEHPDYVPLLHRAYALWNELEEVAGETLFVRSGLLLAGVETGARIQGTLRAREAHGLTIELLPNDDLRRRFPQFRVEDAMIGLFEPDAGYLRVEGCVRAMVSAALRGGASIHMGEQVVDWRSDGGGVIVQTRTASYAAQRLVICGGAWSTALLADARVPLEVLRKVQLWFRCRPGVLEERDGAPVFGFEIGDDFFYGFPQVERGMVKAAEHTGRQTVAHPDQMDRELHDEDVRRVAAFAASHLPGVGPEVARHSVCMYTMTPDEHFVIDRHPAAPNVWFAAGFSGHGFKFAPLAGSILADFALTGATLEPIDFLRLNRAAFAHR